MPKETFESKIKKLEEILEKLESGDIELEKSLEEYKKGMSLAKELEQYLKDFENKISVLNK